jgi:iron complex transport system ATP-binding protein
MRAMSAAIVAMTITTGTALADDMVRLHAAGSLRAAMTVVLSTHDPDHALAIGTQVVLLHEGRIRAAGAPEHALTGPALSTVYGVDVRIERLADGRAVCLPSLARQGPSQRTAPASSSA